MMKAGAAFLHYRLDSPLYRLDGFYACYDGDISLFRPSLLMV
jgi:hypothetical protein